MLQAALDDVDWDMFRASSSDVSEFTDVAVSFVNTLTEQATETITVRTLSLAVPFALLFAPIIVFFFLAPFSFLSRSVFHEFIKQQW